VPVPLPGWLLARLRPPALPAAPVGSIRTREGRVGRYVRAAITAETERVRRAPAGQRNACLGGEGSEDSGAVDHPVARPPRRRLVGGVAGVGSVEVDHHQPGRPARDADVERRPGRPRGVDSVGVDGGALLPPGVSVPAGAGVGAAVGAVQRGPLSTRLEREHRPPPCRRRDRDREQPIRWAHHVPPAVAPTGEAGRRGVTPHSGQQRDSPPWRLIRRSRPRSPGQVRERR
jgi:hypothetical protein